MQEIISSVEQLAPVFEPQWSTNFAIAFIRERSLSMSDRPVIFSGPMVHALLAGRKTQTRRLATSPLVRCVPGDRLYVREAWRPDYCSEGWRDDLGRVAKPSDFDPATTGIEYLADGERELGGRDRPGMHMPRWASRLTLIVEDVRVERLRDIGNGDARDEGVEKIEILTMHDAPWRDYTGRTAGVMSAKESFATLWQSLHGLDSWAANPFVVALTFRVVHGNIDRIEA